MDPEQALNEIVFAALDGAGSWADRCYPSNEAPAKIVRPYVLFFVASAMGTDATPTRRNARYTLSVKAVGDTLQAALTARQEISEALRDAGEQDVTPRLAASAAWHVTTVTEDRAIVINEKIENAISVYHRGWQYVIEMEAN